MFKLIVSFNEQAVKKEPHEQVRKNRIQFIIDGRESLISAHGGKWVLRDCGGNPGPKEAGRWRGRDFLGTKLRVNSVPICPGDETSRQAA